MKDLIFWGATGQAKVLKECLNNNGFKLLALFDNDKEVISSIPEIPLYFSMDEFDKWHAHYGHQNNLSFLVAIGGHNGRARIEIQNTLIKKGLEVIVAVHRTSYISVGAIIGPGSQILAKSFLGVDANLGAGCILNSGSVVDHDCQIADGVHIGPGANLAGNVVVGKFATIYTGATIGPRVSIGEGSIIGAGAVVLKDVPPYSVSVGNPARVLRRLK